MCGIAGIIDLTDSRPVSGNVLRRMADAIIHRGPDEDGYFEDGPFGLANRRLSIVGLKDGRQPIFNEDRSVAVVFNGEFFDYPEVKAQLEAKGHRFATHCDTELIPHLWEEYQEGLFEHLRGQFAFCLWDARQRCLILARDRFGICPLYWSRQGDWLLFGSEVKALLASELFPARPDLRGIDQVFNFFAVPGPATCFEGVSYLQPGHYLRIDFKTRGEVASITQRPFYQMDFPDYGQEYDTQDTKGLVDQFEEVMLAAVDRRLRADVPVVSYLSGGIDSSLVVAMAAKIRGTTIPTFTVQIRHPKLDETEQAAVTARHVGSTPVVVSVGDEEIISTYPELINATEAPVVDTSCTALMMLARSVHQHNYKVALTGEGSDEWLAGYLWYKVHRIFSMFDAIPGIKLSGFLRACGLRLMGGNTASINYVRHIEKTIGDHGPFQDMYSLMNLSRLRFFSEASLEKLRDYSPYLDLQPDFARMRRWHPFNRSLYWAGRIHLPGQLLSLKGDRVAMNSSVETRYPFLDERVFDFLAKLHPRWKMRGMREKYILRLLGERYLPYEVAWRKKGMFRAPLDSFLNHGVPEHVEQLLSEESLRKTGYFNPQAVHYWREQIRGRKVHLLKRTSVEMGMIAVVATQLWHQRFIDSSIADTPRVRSRYNQPALA